MSLEWYLCVINKNSNSNNINNNTNNNINNNNCKCVKYDNFRSANFNLNILGNNFETNLIPVCKYTPIMFHKYILNYKLNNTIFNGKIIIKNT